MRTRRLAFLLALMVVTMAWASLATAGTALADGPAQGSGSSEWGWGGWWILFPVIMMPTMMVFMFMFMRGGVRLPRQDADRDYREPEEHRTARPAESGLEILKRRYASGEITKAEFDEMKQDVA